VIYGGEALPGFSCPLRDLFELQPCILRGLTGG